MTAGTVYKKIHVVFLHGIDSLECNIKRTGAECAVTLLFEIFNALWPIMHRHNWNVTVLK